MFCIPKETSIGILDLYFSILSLNVRGFSRKSSLRITAVVSVLGLSFAFLFWSTAYITTPAKTAAAGGVIKSPLPGTILDIHVKEGQEVTLGTKLMTLEAMKMENVVNSDKEGKVLSIKVGKGDSVMEGDVLIEIGG